MSVKILDALVHRPWTDGWMDGSKMERTFVVWKENSSSEWEMRSRDLIGIVFKMKTYRGDDIAYVHHMNTLKMHQNRTIMEELCT